MNLTRHELPVGNHDLLRAHQSLLAHLLVRVGEEAHDLSLGIEVLQDPVGMRGEREESA